MSEVEDWSNSRLSNKSICKHHILLIRIKKTVFYPRIFTYQQLAFLLTILIKNGCLHLSPSLRGKCITKPWNYGNQAAICVTILPDFYIHLL